MKKWWTFVPNNELGDFQTPLALARACLSLLDVPPVARIFEPTCGQGSFLAAANEAAPGSERVGVEVQPEHATAASAHGKVLNANIFTMDLALELPWDSQAPLYVIGNPPWVTSSELNRMGSENLPAKENFKGARGLDALLGSSNFDVCEYIILKALRELHSEPLTLGMLCKTQVARNVIEYGASAGLPFTGSSVHRIDAMRWFNTSVDACWFTVSLDPDSPPDYKAVLYQSLDDINPTPVRFGVVDGRMVSDIARYEGVRVADGSSPYEWRSGLKHDASSVFELVATPRPATKRGEVLDLEDAYVYPFLKSTDIFRGRHTRLSRWVIVPQQTFGADTAALEHLAPKLWGYLIANGDALDSRKSSVYRNRPRFSVFGHGPYTYASFKVAISGLHKQPVFQLVAPLCDQPVVLDDTCYFLPFDDPTEALVVWAVLSSQACNDLIESLVFWDSKRPITKKLLARIDLNRVPVDRAEIRKAVTFQAGGCGLSVDEGRLYALLGQLGTVKEDTLF